MFSNKPDKRRKAASYNDNAVTILTSGCHFSGKLYCRGSSRIGGRIEGQIVSEGVLIIEEEAQIFADIKAEEVIIQGRVNGKLHSTGRVELCSASHFEGDIVTSTLIVREGAQFNGRSSMLQGAEKEADKKAPRVVANTNGATELGRHPDLAVLKAPETTEVPEVRVK